MQIYTKLGLFEIICDKIRFDEYFFAEMFGCYVRNI